MNINKRIKVGKTERMFVFISGISTGVKNEIAWELHQKLEKSVYINQDDFLVKNKPKITLSDGTEEDNWECVDVINWYSFNNALEACRSEVQKFKYDFVIVVGSILLQEYLTVKPNISFYLDSYSDEIKETLEEYYYRKNFPRNVLLVKEVVRPFNEIVRNKLKVDKVIDLSSFPNFSLSLSNNPVVEQILECIL